MVTVSRSPFSKGVSQGRLTGGSNDDGERNFSLRNTGQSFQTLLDHLSAHSDQLLGRREPGTGQLAPGRGTAGHPKILQRIYRFNDFLTKASFPRPPAPPPTHTGAQCTLQYTYKPADPAVTPGQACRAHASHPSPALALHRGEPAVRRHTSLVPRPPALPRHPCRCSVHTL